MWNPQAAALPRLMRLHYGADATVNVQGSARIAQERRHRDLIRGVHNAWQRATRIARIFGQLKTTERVLVDRIELELAELREIERLHRRIPAVGVTQRKLNGNTHIGGAQMGLHATVGILHHGMDGTLRLHDNLNAVVRHIEQVMRLNHFKAFVHERRRVDRDFRAHVPRGMLERLSRRHIAQFVARAAAERTTARGDPQA